MGVDYSIATAFGWEIEDADVAKIAGSYDKLDHDEPWEEAGEKIGCPIQRVGNSYSGDFTYLVDLHRYDDGNGVAGFQKAATRAEAVRAKALEFGVKLEGEPQLLTRQNVY